MGRENIDWLLPFLIQERTMVWGLNELNEHLCLVSGVFDFELILFA